LIMVSQNSRQPRMQNSASRLAKLVRTGEILR
jgi:hypothetical protein